MYETIAVTTDFTQASRLPFSAAASLARKFRARLDLLHVVQGPQVFTPWQIVRESPEELRQRRAEVQKRLEAFAAAEPAFQGLELKPAALSGESAEAVADYAWNEKTGLIVIATHGYSGVKLFPLGSFAARVIQFVSCPVLIFRAADDAKGGLLPFRPRRILVPHDFSRPSAIGLEVARRWVRAFEAEARLLSVVKPELFLYGDSILTEEDLFRKSQEVQALSRERLERMIQLDWKDLSVEAEVRVGHPALEILREAAEYRPDLVIMASRGLSAVERLPVGSVAERIIHGASCPVLVVK